MKSRVEVRNLRHILCVFPRYAPSFGTFEHAYPLMDGVRAFMPPQGLLVIAAYLPATWQVRLIDENIRPASDEDFAWADAVFVSGMHVQREAIVAIGRRARQFGKASALGGPSVSSCPEHYPEFDYLHIGELGDATDAADRRARRRPAPAGAARSRLYRRGAAAARRFPDPGLRADRGAALFPWQHPVFERLPVSLRVLRHPGALRPPAALQGAPADHRRTRRDARCGDLRLGLFRRRQFHRQQKGDARIAAALPGSPGRRRAAIRSSSPARRRSTSPPARTSWQ